MSEIMLFIDAMISQFSAHMTSWFLKARNYLTKRAYENFSQKILQDSYAEVSQNYRSGNPSHHLKKPEHIMAYAVSRMPAIYEAVQYVLKKLPNTYAPRTILDLGAGLGIASLAALDRFESIDSLVLVEKHPLMLSLQRDMLKVTECINATSLHVDILNVSDLHREPADLVMLSYVLGEISESNQQRAIDQAWKLTQGILCLIGPGTPQDFLFFSQARNYLIQQGGKIIAPCPHDNVCPLVNTPDWCHFSVRLQREKSHQHIKKGKLSYEDEKFSYLLIARDKTIHRCASRIIARPMKRDGHIIFDVCSSLGKHRHVVSKKMPLFKKVSELSWGDEGVSMDPNTDI